MIFHMVEVIKFHHIGYLVKNLEKSAIAFENLGYKRMNGSFDPIQKADILFLEMGKITVELISPHSDSEIYSLLKKYKNTPYHICYEVSDMNAVINDLKEKGYVLFRSPVYACVISEKAVVSFLFNQNVGIIELVQV